MDKQRWRTSTVKINVQGGFGLTFRIREREEE